MLNINISDFLLFIFPQRCWHIMKIFLHSGTPHHLHFPPYSVFDRKFEYLLTVIWGSGDKICSWVVTGFDPVDSGISVSCSYFELYGQTNTKLNIHLKYVVPEGHVVSDNMFIILKLLRATFLSLWFTVWKPMPSLVLWYCHMTCCVLVY